MTRRRGRARVAPPRYGRREGACAMDPRTAERTSLRLAATVLFVGELLTLLVGLLHPAREPANDHPAAFAEYAASGPWTAVHLGQFAGLAVIIAGLLVLFYALDVHAGAAGWVDPL